MNSTKNNLLKMQNNEKYRQKITACMEGVAVCKTYGKFETEVNNLEYDSRKVKDNSAFFALDGIHTDGKSFIKDAIKNGAKTIIYEGNLESFQEGIFYICVKNIRESMARISRIFYKMPDSQMCIIGVTGTEGKSSTTSFIFQLLSLLGNKCGFFSTVSYSYGEETYSNPEHQTTPESTQVFRHLANMRDSGCLYAVLESSSHGLSQKTARLFGVAFDVGVCLNITEEHLEFHKTLSCYRSDKANLFRMIGCGMHKKDLLAIPTFAVINEDDANTEYLKTIIKSTSYSFTHEKKVFEKDAGDSIFLIDERKEDDFLTFSLNYKKSGETKKTQIKTNIAGSYNAENLTACMIVASKLLEKDISEIAPFIEQITAIHGRMTKCDEGQDFEVLIDYAHTPSSFKAILPSMQQKAKKRQARLIVLFGSAGERDIVKREEQGRIASMYADIIILADEDPRGEDSYQLLSMIAKGVEGKVMDEDLFIICKREEAIEKAFSIAKKNDIVLLLGKGHENSIIFSDHVQPYSEKDVAESLLKKIKK